MDRIREIFSRLPYWLFSIITTLLILWLTLMPDSLGDDAPTLFPGADKVVHAIMFGFLSVMLLLDYQRKHGWRETGSGVMLIAAFISSALGILIEFIQRWMAMGRGFDPGDMVADVAGVVICVFLWSLFHRLVWICHKD